MLNYLSFKISDHFCNWETNVWTACLFLARKFIFQAFNITRQWTVAVAFVFNRRYFKVAASHREKSTWSVHAKKKYSIIYIDVSNKIGIIIDLAHCLNMQWICHCCEYCAAALICSRVIVNICYCTFIHWYVYATWLPFCVISFQ